MIISSGRKFIFVHIPKTGGTALSLALEDRAKKDDILIGDTPKAKQRRKRLAALSPKGRLWKHSTLSDIDGIVTQAQIDDMFCFTIVRNPWDRLVSYYHWLGGQSFDHPAVRLSQTLSFENFVVHPLISTSIRSNPAERYMTTVAGTAKCDLYIRLEEWEADKAPLENHLGFQITLPVANVSKRARDYRSYYSDTLAGFVSDLCAEDIGRFGYSF